MKLNVEKSHFIVRNFRGFADFFRKIAKLN